MKKAYTKAEIMDALEWAQATQRLLRSGDAVVGKGALPYVTILIDCADDALELANSREEEARQHDEVLAGTGYQPPDFPEDPPTAQCLRDRGYE